MLHHRQMLRGLILLILFLGLAVLALPFLLSSMYVDQRGVTIPGRVSAKREDVTVYYATVKRSCEVTVEYVPPDTAGVAFLKVLLRPEAYDTFRQGQAVSLHYLLRKDIPDLPLAKVWRELHALPVARLAGQRTLSALEALDRNTIVASAIFAGIVVLLIFWRGTHLPGFLWVFGICLFGGVAALMLNDFPLPMPRPASDVRQVSGKVKSVGRIDKLFNGSHSRGMLADQPIEVVGVQFVPPGRTEPVVAIDLIDAGSVPGLKETSVVDVEYESASPRTAYVRSATRTFVRRNVQGIAVEGVLCLALLLGFVFGAQWLGRAFHRVTSRP